MNSIRERVLQTQVQVQNRFIDVKMVTLCNAKQMPCQGLTQSSPLKPAPLLCLLNTEHKE